MASYSPVNIAIALSIAFMAGLLVGERSERERVPATARSSSVLATAGNK